MTGEDLFNIVTDVGAGWRNRVNTSRLNRHEVDLADACLELVRAESGEMIPAEQFRLWSLVAFARSFSEPGTAAFLLAHHVYVITVPGEPPRIHWGPTITEAAALQEDENAESVASLRLRAAEHLGAAPLQLH